MKKMVMALTAGLLIGGAALGGPLTATAQENTELEQRVQALEERFHTLCVGARIERPRLYDLMLSYNMC